MIRIGERLPQPSSHCSSDHRNGYWFSLGFQSEVSQFLVRQRGITGEGDQLIDFSRTGKPQPRLDDRDGCPALRPPRPALDPAVGAFVAIEGRDPLNNLLLGQSLLFTQCGNRSAKCLGIHWREQMKFYPLIYRSVLIRSPARSDLCRKYNPKIEEPTRRDRA